MKEYLPTESVHLLLADFSKIEPIWFMSMDIFVK